MNRISLFFAIILFAATGGAQTAKVTGKAMDPSGALITGADVALLGPGNTTVAATKTGADGSFTLDVPPGSYALEITSAWPAQAGSSRDSKPAKPAKPALALAQA